MFDRDSFYYMAPKKSYQISLTLQITPYRSLFREVSIEAEIFHLSVCLFLKNIIQFEYCSPIYAEGIHYHDNVRSSELQEVLI